MFTGIRAFLQIIIDFAPCNDLQRIRTFLMKPVHTVDIQLIGFFLQGIDPDDMILQRLRMAKIRSSFSRLQVSLQQRITISSISSASERIVWR